MAKHIHAVLTGDIIKSSDLEAEALASARQSLAEAAAAVRRWRDAPAITEISFSRGDEWQLALDRPAAALKVAIFLRASLTAAKSADTRIAIGLGRADGPLASHTADASGEAYRLSGRGLDSMTNRSGTLIALLPEDIAAHRQWINAIAVMCGAIMDDWSPAQARAVAATICAPEATYEELGDQLGISQQAVSKALAGARWQALEVACTAFVETDWTSMLGGDRTRPL